MKVILLFVWCLSMFIVGAVLAQGPAQGQDGSPAAAETMVFIQDKLNNQGMVTSGTGTEYQMVELSDAKADPRSCTLSYNSRVVSGLRETALTAKLSFRDVEKLTVAPIGDPDTQSLLAIAANGYSISGSDQPIFLMVLSMTKKVKTSEHFSSLKKTKKGGDVKNGGSKLGEANKDYPVLVFSFCEADLANRVAKAMLHAVELCGGGNSKEPF